MNRIMGINMKSDDKERLASLRDSLASLQARVSLPQLVALLAIAAEPGLSVNELAERLDIPQQTASRHVAALTGRYQNDFADAPEVPPLVLQEINQIDPRKRALFLAPPGLELISSL